MRAGTRGNHLEALPGQMDRIEKLIVNLVVIQAGEILPIALLAQVLHSGAHAGGHEQGNRPIKARREGRRPVCYHSMHAHRQRADIVGDSGNLGSPPNIFEVRRKRALDIIAQAARKQPPPLPHVPDLTAERGQIEPGKIAAIKSHTARRWLFEPDQQGKQGRFTAARRPHQGQKGPRPDGPRDAVQDLAAILVFEGEVHHLHRAAQIAGVLGRGHGFGGVFQQRLGVELLGLLGKQLIAAPRNDNPRHQKTLKRRDEDHEPAGRNLGVRPQCKPENGEDQRDRQDLIAGQKRFEQIANALGA